MAHHLICGPKLHICGSQKWRGHNVLQNLKFTAYFHHARQNPNSRNYSSVLSCYGTLEKPLFLNDYPVEKSEEQTDVQAITRVLTVNHTHTVAMVQAPL